MTKHHGRRAARLLATGVMGPTTTTTRRITTATASPVPKGSMWLITSGRLLFTQ